MKKYIALLLVLLFSSSAAWSMGGASGDAPTSIPLPAKNFKVTLTDTQGVSIELDNFSLDGQVAVSGQKGQGQVAVPFDNLKSVRFLSQQDKFIAQITLRQGEPLELTVKPGQKATGKTSYGNFSISLKDVSHMDIKAQ